MNATPPERLREQVLRDIAKVRPLAPAVSQEAGDRIEATSREHAATQAADAPTSRVSRLSDARRRRNRWFAAAAAVIALGGGAALAATQPWNSSSQVQNDIAAQVQQAPDAQRYQQTLADGSTVTVVRSKSVGRAVLVTDNLAAAPSGKTYQMWLQAAGGSFASAGLVPPGSNRDRGPRGRRGERAGCRSDRRAQRWFAAADDDTDRPVRLRLRPPRRIRSTGWSRITTVRSLGLTMPETPEERRPPWPSTSPDSANVGGSPSSAPASQVSRRPTCSARPAPVTLYEADPRLGGHADTHDRGRRRTHRRRRHRVHRPQRPHLPDPAAPLRRARRRDPATPT